MRNCKPIRIAAYQAPLLDEGYPYWVELIQQRVRECEAKGISILCCPEAILGGLADYSDEPLEYVIRSDNGQLASVLAPLASESVTSIVGFSEIARDGALYNAAAIFQRGRVAGVYRKIHPAIRRSAYAAGSAAAVFLAGGLTFSIVICNDSNYSELARGVAGRGATVLFIPTNNGLPYGRDCAGAAAAARNTDIARAVENGIWVVRADVAGDNGKLRSYGSSETVDPQGNLVQQAQPFTAGMLVSEIDARLLRASESRSPDLGPREGERELEKRSS